MDEEHVLRFCTMFRDLRVRWLPTDSNLADHHVELLNGKDGQVLNRLAIYLREVMLTLRSIHEMFH